ncbi:MAG: AI-2E family transporter [Pirellulales bacterium]
MIDDTTRFFRRVGTRFATPLRHAAGLLGRVASQANIPESEQRRRNAAVGALFMAVLRADGRQTTAELAQIEALFQANFGKREAVRIRESLDGVTEINLEECGRVLESLEREEAQELVRGMFELGWADGELSNDEVETIAAAARVLGVDEPTLQQCRQDVFDERGKRSAIVKSGAGILVALVVLAIFVFTATFLKSVLFGLMLAYFVLPLQRWFQWRFFPNSQVQSALALLDRITSPFRRVYRRLKAPFQKEKAPPSTNAYDWQVTRACHATMATLVCVMVVVAGTLTWASTRFVASWRLPQTAAATASSSAQTTPPAATNSASSVPSGPLGTPSVAWLERYRPMLERSDFLRLSSEIVKEYLTDEAKKKELLGMVFHNLQPLLLRAGGFLSMLANWLLDAMMTLFFFSFFLQRIAAGQSPEKGREKPTSRYLVETIFASGWLPAADSNAIRDAHVILDEILTMLQTWVKGYLWIIIIESALYITAFAILGVPYFPVLGILAGMTVLLPFIGPVASCLLTLVVTFAFQSPSVTMLVLIVGVYLFNNAIIEQLILFPALVGEALGLNALETIIVVLLGGLVAGLAGAVFAIPVAAILKYLVPQIYRSLSGTNRASAAS